MDKIIVLIIFSSPVVIYLYSANTRINLTCPECCEVDISMEVKVRLQLTRDDTIVVP
jgi:hypothetical protein